MHMPYMTRIGAALLCMALFVGGARAGDDVVRPTAADARSAYEAGTQFVDVRSDAEWTDGHLKGALHLPVDQVASLAASDLPNKDAPLVLYCQSGKRAQSAADVLQQLGYTHVVAMTGGYDDLKAEGYPVVE
jgi:phage shock protein E